MAVYHGKNLKIEFGTSGSEVEIDDVTQIVVNETSNVQPYVSSSTSASTSRVAGATDATGSFTVLGETVPAGCTKGTTGNLIATPVTGQSAAWDGAIIITDTSHSTSSEGLPTVTINWGKT